MQAEQSSRPMKESEKSASELFEAHGDSAMIFDLHEKAFNTQIAEACRCSPYCKAFALSPLCK